MRDPLHLRAYTVQSKIVKNSSYPVTNYTLAHEMWVSTGLILERGLNAPGNVESSQIGIFGTPNWGGLIHKVGGRVYILCGIDVKRNPSVSE